MWSVIMIQFVPQMQYVNRKIIFQHGHKNNAETEIWSLICMEIYVAYCINILLSW